MSHLNRILSHLAYPLLMKFSVAPESKKAEASALLLDMCRNTCIDIDWRFDKYTQSELIDLIKAALIRPSENPAPLLDSIDQTAPSFHQGSFQPLPLWPS